METMRYTERKKNSNGIVIGFFLFVIIGGAIIYFAMKQEAVPVIVGNNQTQVDNLVDVDKDKNAVNVLDIKYEITNKTYSDKTNKRIKSDITLPVITIEDEELIEINTQIDEKYTELFSVLKESLSSADNSYTYKITYNVYEHLDETKNSKYISITVYDRVVDDSAKKNTTESLGTYVIDVESKELKRFNDVAVSYFGKDYKTKINGIVRSYLVSKSMIKEDDYTYAITGLEKFYIKESKLHIVFNEGEIVDKKYGVLDIILE